MSEGSIAVGARASPLRWLFGELPCARPAGRLLDVDAARGLAIILVVVGHVGARVATLEDAGWYADLKAAIYLFHMPLFMALTGITFALSLPAFTAWSEAARFSFKRVERLLVPYVVFGLVVILGKLAASRVMHVDRAPQDLAGELYLMLVMPGSSVTVFIWFIYVVSIYLLLVPALFRLIGRRPMLLFIASLVLQLGEWPQLFMLDRVVEYLPFFAGGMLLWMHRAAWLRIMPAALWPATIVFVALLVLSLWLKVPKWLVGAVSVPAVLAWMHLLPAQPQGWLAALGRASLAIYLMNTIAIGLVKGLMLKFLPWHGVNFLLYFPLLTLAGIALPLLVASFVKRHAPRAGRYLGTA